jgi:hypothetical protein
MWIAAAAAVVVIILGLILVLGGLGGGGAEDADATGTSEAGTAIALIALSAVPADTATPTVTPSPEAVATDVPVVVDTDAPTATDTATPEPTATDTAVPTNTPTLTHTPTLTATPTATPTYTPTATYTPSATPTESLDYTDGDSQVLLLYDGRTLVVYNRDPSDSVNIRQLTFVQVDQGEEIVFEATRWTTGDLRSVRPHTCYQVWTNAYSNLPANEPPADVCESRQGFFGTVQLFWLSANPVATFEVRRGNDVLAVCPVSRPNTYEQTRCAVDVRR